MNIVTGLRYLHGYLERFQNPPYLRLFSLYRDLIERYMFTQNSHFIEVYLLTWETTSSGIL
jgi:hypothetical protein